MSGDPIAWIMIEKGWAVYASDGEHVGRIEEIAGDEKADIFDGLSVDAHLFDDDVYVPAEQVGTITEGRVELTLTTEQFGELGPYVEPAAQIRIDPGSAPLGTRIHQELDNILGSGDSAKELRAHRETWLQRFLRHLLHK
jgi:hypothetical protein